MYFFLLIFTTVIIGGVIAKSFINLSNLHTFCFISVTWISCQVPHTSFMVHSHWRTGTGTGNGLSTNTLYSMWHRNINTAPRYGHGVGPIVLLLVLVPVNVHVSHSVNELPHGIHGFWPCTSALREIPQQSLL